MAKGLGSNMRIWHRYLGFFLAGIMAVYAISGIIMIFRDTDFLKVEKQMQKTLKPHLDADAVGKELRIRELKATSETETVLSFKEGTYNKETGEANFSTKQLPTALNKLTQLHKASSKQPLFFLNVFFGVSLFFFVLSSFWMFLPKTTIFKKGLYFTAAGLLLTLILLFM